MSEVQVKDRDGARTLHLEVKDGSLYLWGRGFSYEFDESLFLHAMSKAIMAIPETAVAAEVV